MEKTPSRLESFTSIVRYSTESQRLSTVLVLMVSDLIVVVLLVLFGSLLIFCEGRAAGVHATSVLPAVGASAVCRLHSCTSALPDFCASTVCAASATALDVCSSVCH